MKKLIRNTFILLLPFLLMMIINESIRPSLSKKGHHQKGVIAMNPGTKSISTCSWYCHQDTRYCKQNHVKFLQGYFNYTDPIYFGIIQSFHSTGNYGLANILILVILFPLIMFILLIKSINIQTQIKAIKNARSNH